MIKIKSKDQKSIKSKNNQNQSRNDHKYLRKNHNNELMKRWDCNSGSILQPLGQDSDAGTLPAEIHRRTGTDVHRHRRLGLVHGRAPALLPAGRIQRLSRISSSILLSFFSNRPVN